MKPQTAKKEVAVLLGRALEFFEFVKTLDRPKVYRSRLRAETDDSIYRGFCNPEMSQGINPNSLAMYGTYRQRFTPEDIDCLELAVRVTNKAPSGPRLIDAAKEMVAHVKGEIALTTRIVTIYGQGKYEV